MTESTPAVCGNRPHLTTRWTEAVCLLPAGHPQRHEWPVEYRPTLAWPVGREYGTVTVEDVRASSDAIRKYAAEYDDLVEGAVTAPQPDIWERHLELARLEAEHAYLLERLLQTNLDTPKPQD